MLPSAQAWLDVGDRTDVAVEIGCPCGASGGYALAIESRCGQTQVHRCIVGSEVCSDDGNAEVDGGWIYQRVDFCARVRAVIVRYREFEAQRHYPAHGRRPK